jgi:hypothetical protein
MLSSQGGKVVTVIAAFPYCYCINMFTAVMDVLLSFMMLDNSTEFYPQISRASLNAGNIFFTL